MRDLLLELERDLVQLSSSVQIQMRSVAGNAQCSTCLSPITSSLNSNIFRIISKIRTHIGTHSMYNKIKSRVKELQQSRINGEIDKNNYAVQRAALNFYLAEVDNAFRDMDLDEVPDSLVISILKRQMVSLEKRLEQRDSEALTQELELIKSLLPPEAGREQMEALATQYLLSNPGAKFKDVRNYLVENLNCNDRELNDVIQERLRSGATPTATA